MGLLDAVFHITNFLAPAMFVAITLALLGRWIAPRKPKGVALWVQVAINFAVGLAAMMIGMWYFGRDGKMATYAALVILVGTAQWLAAGSRRR